ncbi:MAG: hypothetical protein WAV45_03095 [Propionibacteriaceae bacterium]|nr:hypothetical protein [Micropruina sp.]
MKEPNVDPGMMRRIFLTAGAIVLALALTMATAGCSLLVPPRRAFETREEARPVMLSMLQTKYGIEFTLVDDNPLTERTKPGILAWYAAHVTAADDPAKTANVNLSEYGTLRDDFARNLYRHEIEERGWPACRDVPGVAECQVHVAMSVTTVTWDATTPFDEFVAKSGVHNDVRVTLSHQESDAAYADRIYAVVSALYDSGVPFTSEFTLDGIVRSTTNYSPGYNKRTRDQILKDFPGPNFGPPGSLPTFP